MLFDTHTHIDQSDFDGIRDAVVERAVGAGVGALIAVGTTAAASSACVELAARYAQVYAAVGIQPNYVAESVADDWAVIENLATAPGVVAIGETGLDRHWDHTPFDQQQDYFDRHMRLADRHGLPFIVHMRDCDEDILDMLRQARRQRPLTGVMHSFTGDSEMAAECVDLGLYISFAGMITYKKSQDLRDVATTIPAERLLIETDSPYLSPEPVRGQRPNEPAHLRHTAELMARVRNLTPGELAELTTANARRLFKMVR
jgi:TatD DNase family protein